MSQFRDRFAMAVQGVIVLCALTFAVTFQKKHFAKMEVHPELFTQKLRLPNAEVLKVGSLGFRNLYVDFMFLRAIQAYGAGWLKPGESREPIYQYFSTVSQVDPKFIPMYRFGNLIIADQGGDGSRGQMLLRQGIIANPTSWDLAYLGIYNAIWNMNEPDDARWFLAMANKMPDVPNYVLRMEEYVERRLGRYETAFDVNVDYFIRYQRAGNEAERMLLYNRFYDILEKWSMKIVHTGIEAYIADAGGHPLKLEDIIKPEYLGEYEMPLIELLEKTSDEVAMSDMPLEEAVEYVRKNSRTKMFGLPVEPRGTWFYISTDMLNSVMAQDLPTTAPPELRFAYVVTPITFFPRIDQHTNLIEMNYIRPAMGPNMDQEVPIETVDRWLTPDPIGGHYVWDPLMPRFYSTARVRIGKGQDPRCQVTGYGPFPLPLEPTLLDYDGDRAWALEKGIYDAKGVRQVWDPEDGMP